MWEDINQEYADSSRCPACGDPGSAMADGRCETCLSRRTPCSGTTAAQTEQDPDARDAGHEDRRRGAKAIDDFEAELRRTFRVEPYTGPQPTTEAKAAALDVLLAVAKPMDGSQTCDYRLPRGALSDALRLLSASTRTPSATYCPANADHRHRDAGGMFTFSCRDCGWIEDDTFGADMSGDHPRLRR